MAQNEFFTPINQSPFGDVVFNCVGLPTVLDSHQGSWKTFSDQKELCTIELLSPPNIILKHADGRFLGEIKLSASMQFHQPSVDSLIIQTNQRVYGIRLANSRDSEIFMNTLSQLHEVLKRSGDSSNMQTKPIYAYQQLHQPNSTNNIQYGIPQNDSPPMMSPIQQIKPQMSQQQSVKPKQMSSALPTAQPMLQPQWQQLEQQLSQQQQHQQKTPQHQQQQQLNLQMQLLHQLQQQQQQQQYYQQQQSPSHPYTGFSPQHSPIDQYTDMIGKQPKNLLTMFNQDPFPKTGETSPNVMYQNFITDESKSGKDLESDINAFKSHNSQSPPPSEEELACDVLSEAIERGNIEKAKEISSQLAKKNCKLTVQLLDYETIEKQKDFHIIVYVEDKVDPGGAPIPVCIDPQITVGMLKYKVAKEYDFPVAIQRWIINDRLLKDNETLVKCGVKTSGTVIYLYLLSMEDDQKRRDVHTQTKPSINEEAMRQQTMQYNINNMPGNMSPFSPFGGSPNWPPYGQNMPQLGQFGLQPQIPQVLPQNHQIFTPPSMGVIPPLKIVKSKEPLARKEGWECPKCTFKNPPTFPGCKMCSSNCPDDYKVPDNYQLDPEEQERLKTEQMLEKLTLQAEFNRKAEEVKMAQRNYLQTMEHVQQKILPNPTPFDCPICFTNFGKGEAVMLRECLHCFCRDCLAETIKASEDPEVRCPHNDGFPCPAIITGQEIEQLLSREDFAKFLDRSLAAAEHGTENSFHCRTPNCKGWCIYEDEVNSFLCPVCEKQNCLTCKAIHPDKTCKQYQDELKIRAENDEAAKKTQQMLEELITRGDAMNCPKCKIILQKKSGCDWMKCTMCRTEICWATKGPRWGPNGPGDTSGGCKCKFNGKRCTPTCGNCH